MKKGGEASLLIPFGTHLTEIGGRYRRRKLVVGDLFVNGPREIPERERKREGNEMKEPAYGNWKYTRDASVYVCDELCRSRGYRGGVDVL